MRVFSGAVSGVPEFKSPDQLPLQNFVTARVYKDPNDSTPFSYNEAGLYGSLFNAQTTASSPGWKVIADVGGPGRFINATNHHGSSPGDVAKLRVTIDGVVYTKDLPSGINRYLWGVGTPGGAFYNGLANPGFAAAVMMGVPFKQTLKVESYSSRIVSSSERDRCACLYYLEGA